MWGVRLKIRNLLYGLFILMILSMNPICAVEMGIETDTNSSLNQGTGETIEDNSNENIIITDAIESPTILPDNYHKGAVESPNLYTNPSHNDIEGHHPETHSDYGQDLDPWPAIIFVTDVITTVITVTVAARAGIAAYRIAMAKRELKRIGVPWGLDFGGEGILIQMNAETAPIVKIFALIDKESDICIGMRQILKFLIPLTILTSIGVYRSNVKGNMYNSWTH